jgi:hypothetical protein
MTIPWTADWAWSLPLIALTLAMHVAAVILLAVFMLRAKLRFDRRPRGVAASALFTILMIAAAGWALAVLHGAEAGIWGGVYLLLGAIDNPADAMYFSVDSMTTRGASGVDLARHWKMMGALEAANGVLLFGVSTAFLAAVLTEAWSNFRKLEHKAEEKR